MDVTHYIEENQFFRKEIVLSKNTSAEQDITKTLVEAGLRAFGSAPKHHASDLPGHRPLAHNTLPPFASLRASARLTT